MRNRFVNILCLVILIVCSGVVSVGNGQATVSSLQLPSIETLLLEPIELENVSVWVPASKEGPVINRSCRPQKNCSYSSVLPSSVHHTKTETCPDEIGRLLAEYTHLYHEQNLPLTIFNGWQWEYFHSLSQFISIHYNLPRRGGSWEYSCESILTQSSGSVRFQWIHPLVSDDFAKELNNIQNSDIEVRTFDFMRARDGYPKKRQL
ncbi:hypothetical protein ACFL3G_05490 [Planctomycetota bacterium]